ncbi:MAG TPA: MotA/TolQ/ExbB proton channel family protein [bacterium]|nr:MotA/TolQ/ExbB proton channel family protein [bacterium]HPN35736.1 MotA/TolQ/ExbB proton channel family protein [bacterium]
MSLMEFIFKGGVMMLPIIICSILAIGAFIERIMALRKINTNSRTFILQIKNLIYRKKVEEAVLLCKETPGPVAAITLASLLRRDKPREEMKEAIESAGKTAIYKLEKNLGILGNVAAIAPMFGFLGTVTGMIKAFMQIQMRGGAVDASVLAGGIWEALITTAAGLIVGIPALLGHNYIAGKVEQHVFEMQENSVELLDVMLDKEAGVEL